MSRVGGSRRSQRYRYADPETAIAPADNTFHRWSAPRGGRHNRVREDLLRVVVPEHDCSVHRRAVDLTHPGPIQVCPPNPGGQGGAFGRNAPIPLILLQVDYQRLLERAMAAAAATAGRGQVADYIPALATVDPDAFGMAMATFDGEIYGVGQVERPFSIQSVSKLFTLALLLAEIGDRVWQGVGREPSGNPFNSIRARSDRAFRATR